MNSNRSIFKNRIDYKHSMIFLNKVRRVWLMAYDRHFAVSGRLGFVTRNVAW